MISISDLKQLICKIFLVIDSTNEAHCFITLHWIKIQHLSRKWKCWQSNAHQEISRNIYLKTMLDLRETGKPQNIYTAWKVSKYGVFSGPYFPAFGLRPATLLKKKLWHRCFPENFARFLRTPFLQNTSGWLLQDVRLCYISLIETSEAAIQRCSLKGCCKNFYRLHRKRCVKEFQTATGRR